MPIRHGTYIREPDGALLLYHSEFFYINAASAFRIPYNRVNDFRTVRDNDEIKRFSYLKPGEYEEFHGDN